MANPNEDKEVYATLITANDYIWRGFSLTTYRPALQGEYNLKIPKSPIKGLYANFFVSNVRFNGQRGETERLRNARVNSTFSDSEGDGGPNLAFIEIDLNLGVSNELSKNASYTIWFARYLYPGPTKSAYNEYLAEFNFKFLTTLVGYTSNVYNSNGKAFYYNVGVDFKVPEYLFKVKDINVGGGIGHYFLPLVAGVPSYTDYNVQIGKNFKNYGLSLAWTNTNVRSVPYGGNRLNIMVATFL